MGTSIVTVNVSQTVAPAPSNLQRKGAMLSQGGTTTAPGTLTLLTAESDLTGIKAVPLSLTTLTQTAGLATATAAAAHGIPVGKIVRLTIAGAVPSGYNGTFDCTATTTTAFTYAVNSGLTSPATGTKTYVPASADELTQMVNTFFAQGSQLAVYVLELGLIETVDAVAYLGTWIGDNPNTIYSYLVPRAWSDSSDFLALVVDFDSTTAKTYFFTTMTLDNYTDFTALMKSVFGLVESPTKPATEFSAAAPFWITLNYKPSSTNKVTPLSFSYVSGVTPYPVPGNNATFAALKAAGVNYISTGAEGGISNAMLVWGTTMDVRPFNYWYSVDWVAINGSQAIANAVINGSNNPINPLYYNQQGIDRLQQVLASVMSSGITFGLVLGNVQQTAFDGNEIQDAIDSGKYTGLTLVNAVPFIPYNTANPSDYRLGVYDGLSVEYTPARGFESITINVNVTDFVAAAV